MERKIGKSGGITIPSNLRRDIGMAGGEKVDIAIKENGDIIIKRIAGICVFCGSFEDVAACKGRFVCAACRKELGGFEDAGK